MIVPIVPEFPATDFVTRASAGAAEAGLHRACGPARRGNDLLIAGSLDITQDHDQPLIGGQFVKRGLEGVSEFSTEHALIRAFAPFA